MSTSEPQQQKLSGLTLSKNCLSLDYCIRECIESMLPICSEVVVGEGGSTDGTLEMLQEWSKREPKIRVVMTRDWTLERGNAKWFTSWINEARSHVREPMLVQMDSDEVLSDDRHTRAIIEKCVEKRDAICVNRLNFVRDAHSLIPEGECLGRFVTRVGPSHLWWPSDEPHSAGEVELLSLAHIETQAKIFHVGFLRKPEAFYAKARVVLGAFFNDFDKRLVETETKKKQLFENYPWWGRLDNYEGYYPEAVRRWMEARGHKV